MKKQVKEVKEKDIKTTVSVASIATKVVYKNKYDSGILLSAIDDFNGSSSSVSIAAVHVSGFSTTSGFHNTDEIRRCLDHFDEMREENKKILNAVIDFEEVEKPVEKQD